ncbi:hypothetical protein OIU76_023107, partial [Salix suchowensis]
MSCKGRPQLTVSQIPNLHCLVPRSGNNRGLQRIWA